MPNEEPELSAYDFTFVGGELNSYLFKTLTEITYEVRFTPTPYLFGENSPYADDTFELSLLINHNPTGRTPPFDRLTARTLAAIFGDFYVRSADTVTLYICASYDGRQMLRQQLFHRWFYYFERDDFTKVDDIIRDSGDTPYPLTLIIKHKNPYRIQIIEAFLQATSGYRAGK